ncbi:hypothetical protein MRX96_025652 [Rhipicephalus microplus]
MGVVVSGGPRGSRLGGASCCRHVRASLVVADGVPVDVRGSSSPARPSPPSFRSCSSRRRLDVSAHVFAVPVRCKRSQRHRLLGARILSDFPFTARPFKNGYNYTVFF